MKRCAFCHEIEREDEVCRCRRCGYRLETIQPGRQPAAEVFTLSFREGDGEKTDVTAVDFDGWNMLFKAYSEQRLTAQLREGALVLSVSYQKSDRPFSVDDLSEPLPEQWELKKESWCDEINESGFRVYRVEMLNRSRLSLRDLSPPQRRRFLEWLLTTPPHAAEDGSLCFEL